MKLLTDENIGLEIVAFFRKNGHDVRSITEISPGVFDVPRAMREEFLREVVERFKKTL